MLITWPSSDRTSRYEETIIARLRIGHTRLTHAYLFLGLFSPPPCQYCNEDHLIVQNLFSCPVLETSHLLLSEFPLLSATSVTTQNKSLKSFTKCNSTGNDLSLIHISEPTRPY